MLFLLCGCVFPLQHVSPIPNLFPPFRPPGPPSALPDFAISPPPGMEDAPGSAEEPAELEESRSDPVAIEDPKLAVFWYAMADAEVYSFREQFGPLLEASGFPFREFDVENDRYRQLDQIRGRCCLLAVGIRWPFSWWITARRTKPKRFWIWWTDARFSFF